MAGFVKAEDFKRMLDELLQNDPEVEGASLVTSDGLVVSAVFQTEGIEEDEIGAMSAALLGISERVVQDFNRGELIQTILKGPNGYAVAHKIGEDWVLVLITSPRAKLGMIQFNLKAITQEMMEFTL